VVYQVFKTCAPAPRGVGLCCLPCAARAYALLNNLAYDDYFGGMRGRDSSTRCAKDFQDRTGRPMEVWNYIVCRAVEDITGRVKEFSGEDRLVLLASLVPAPEPKNVDPQLFSLGSWKDALDEIVNKNLLGSEASFRAFVLLKDWTYRFFRDSFCRTVAQERKPARWCSDRPPPYLRRPNRLPLPRRRLHRLLRVLVLPRHVMFIAGLWKAHLKTNRMHDSRTARHPVLADNSQQSWQRVIGPDDSVIVRDSTSGQIILVVIRNFCPDAGVLTWFDSVVRKGAMAKKSVRFDDPGSLALVLVIPGTSFTSMPRRTVA
jgi:hypothetical protein